MSDRVYSEEEVAKVIRRAVELEAEREKRGNKDSKEGLTIKDLERIAADAGIDPELMQRAVNELQDGVDTADIENVTKINKKEIVAEYWIDGEANSRILDNLVIELNQHFGTSQDEISWWNTLFNDYSGKALVNKTRTSVDWKYTTESEFYTTRALIQQRGEKLRIRVSKRMAWNLPWKSEALNIFFGATMAVLFSIIGAAVGFWLMESTFLGILGGVALTALIIPLYSKYNKHWLKGHAQEVTDIAENLVIQAKQMVREFKENESESQSASQSDLNQVEIDIDSSEETSHSSRTQSSGRIRNHLRD